MLGENHFIGMDRGESLDSNLAKWPESATSNNFGNDDEKLYPNRRAISSGINADYGQNSVDTNSNAEIDRLSSELNSRISREIASVVIALVVDSAEWEKQLLSNVVPILACLKGRDQLSTMVVEGDALVGKALAATIAPKTPFVTGMVTQTTVFEETRRQFLIEFSGLDPLSILEYFRIRLMSVVQERFLDRLPHLREVSFTVYRKGFCL